MPREHPPTTALAHHPRRPRYDIDSLDNRDPAIVQRLVQLLEPIFANYFQAEVRHVERVERGASLLVGNHNAGLLAPEAFLTACALHRAGGMDLMPYALAHEVALNLPVVRDVLSPLGAVRASHANAMKAFDRGHKVLVYPGGDVDAMRPYRHRNRVVFGGRVGYVRLALRAGVPIVPIVAAGAHSTLVILDDMRWLATLIGARKHLRTEVWPLALSFPWGLTLGPIPPYVPWPSRIIMEFLEPIHFDRQGDEAAADSDYVRRCADRVEDAMQARLTALAAERKRKSGEPPRWNRDLLVA